MIYPISGTISSCKNPDKRHSTKYLCWFQDSNKVDWHISRYNRYNKKAFYLGMMVLGEDR